MKEKTNKQTNKKQTNKTNEQISEVTNNYEWDIEKREIAAKKERKKERKIR